MMRPAVGALIKLFKNDSPSSVWYCAIIMFCAYVHVSVQSVNLLTATYLVCEPQTHAVL